MFLFKTCDNGVIMLAHIPVEMIPYFERAIYLPMLLIVLEKDYEQIEVGKFKLKRPYFHLIEKVRKKVEEDLKETKTYMKHHRLKLVRGLRDDLFTEYFFHYEQAVEMRRYSNIRLRNQVEKLLEQYLFQGSKISV